MGVPCHRCRLVDGLFAVPLSMWGQFTPERQLSGQLQYLTENWLLGIEVRSFFVRESHFKFLYTIVKLLCSQSFATRLGVGIEVRSFPQTNDSVSHPDLISNIISRGMIRTTIIPNCNIILIPLETDLQVMIQRNKFEQIIKMQIRFIFRQFHNTFSKSKSARRTKVSTQH